ncbi:MAG: hypothetical protein K2X35_13180 [Bryobacteraceae bacterium]|nr:hypothetical protein [Bryobacteraceae bacterium]
MILRSALLLAIAAFFASAQPFTDIILSSGVPEQFPLPVRASAALQCCFRIDVPAGANRLEIRVSNVSTAAQIALAVRFGQQPSPAPLIADYPVTIGTRNLTILPASNPPLRAGSYYIGIVVATNPTAQTGTMTATVTLGPPPDPPGISTSVNSLDFTTTEGRNPSPRTFTVRNSGGGTLNFEISAAESWLSASPARATSTGQNLTITVLANVAGLATGTYNGTLRITAPDVTPVQIPVRLQVNRTPPTRLTSVSAASLATAVAPDAIVSSFGAGLASAVEAASTADLPDRLGDTTLAVTDATGVEHQCKLYFVSPGQINFLLNSRTATGDATVRVRRGATVVAEGTLRVQPVAPAIFTANNSGRGVAAAQVFRIAADGTQSLDVIFQCASAGNCTPVPVDPAAAEQSFILLYGTGLRGRSAASAVRATVGGRTAEISDAVPQGQYPGLDQANLRLTRDMAGRGVVDVVITVDGQASNTFTIHLGGAAPPPPPPAGQLPPVPTGRVYQPAAPGLEWTYRVTFPQNVRIPHKPVVEEPAGLLCSNVFCGLQTWNAGQIEFKVSANDLVSSANGTELWNATVSDRGGAFYFPTAGPIQIRRRPIGGDVQLELVHQAGPGLRLSRPLSRPSSSALTDGVIRPETLMVPAGTFTGVITTEIVLTGDSTSGFNGTYRTELKLAPYVGIIRAVMRDPNNQILFTQELLQFTQPSPPPLPRFRISNLTIGTVVFQNQTTRIPLEFDFEDPSGTASTGSLRLTSNLDGLLGGFGTYSAEGVTAGQTSGRMRVTAGIPLLNLIVGRRYTFTFVISNSAGEESNPLSGSFVR